MARTTETRKLKVVRNPEVPEMFGVSETADCLGVAPGNLQWIRDLPPPVMQLRCGQLWLASQVREFARIYKRRRGLRKAA